MTEENSNTTIVARYVNPPISVTDFDHAVWQSCQSVTIDRYWNDDRAHTDARADVKICWSDEALNVRFDCMQIGEPILSPLGHLDKKTIGLWDYDVCEIFLAPHPETPSRYFEFEAAPNGQWLDLGIVITPTRRETDWDFSSGMTTAATTSQWTLTIGIRIPWSDSIPKPQKGDVWRTNVFRCVGPEAPERYLAWRPTRTPEPNYHVPEAFGMLRFE